MKTTNKKQCVKQILNFGLANLEKRVQPDSVYGCDLHHELFNMEYFNAFINTSAEDFLTKYGVFDAFEKITTYETEQFGSVNTMLGEPDKVLNMLAYVIGEEILQECETLHSSEPDQWNGILTAKSIKKIKAEMKKAIHKF